MLQRTFTKTLLPAACIALLSACDTETRAPEQVTIDFAAQISGDDFTCGDTYTNVGTGGHDLKVNDFRMYIHDPYLVDTATGQQYPISLTQDGIWQLDNIAMLDFEDASVSPDCNGTPETNSQITGEVSLPVFFDRSNTEICFTVGLPFDKNHLDESTAASPLNASGMLWAWKIGRKYVRIDAFGDPAGANNGFNLHLGAQGNCGTLSATQAPDQECSVPNTIPVCLANFDLDNNRIAVDPAPVFEANDVSVNLVPNGMGSAAPKPGCMSFIDDDDCEEIMPRLGLDYAYGRSMTGVESSYASGQRLIHKL